MRIVRCGGRVLTATVVNRTVIFCALYFMAGFLLRGKVRKSMQICEIYPTLPVHLVKR